MRKWPSNENYTRNTPAEVAFALKACEIHFCLFYPEQQKSKPIEK